MSIRAFAGYSLLCGGLCPFLRYGNGTLFLYSIIFCPVQK